ncbi:MAG: precorrin-2 C(20)-methyltransferase [bacterium]|nr:precorrin-2 C(20)-methyltransferase [bacterium]MDE0415570.1 precorrin-2 C(20)-methyltransferase [bacterium]
MTAGVLYGLGVGPGDPELVTLKAYRILGEVPVIAWPAPQSGESLARSIIAPWLRGDREEIAIRMPLDANRFPAEEVYSRAVDAISRHLDAGRDVAAICEGDPFFYGSFMYLFARVADRYQVEVVPGVSSLMACPAAAGVPLAARNDALLVCPGTLGDAAMTERLALADSVAIIKVGRHLARIRRVLDAAGLLSDAWYVAHATMGHQVVMPLAAVTDAAGPYFSMILVHRRGEAWR